MANGSSDGKTRWITIGLPIVIAAVGVLGFIYAVGQRTNKIVDVVDWKHDVAPRIERMDSKGTLSFEIFHEEYLRTQSRQEEWLRKIERDVHDKEMSDLKDRILTLERRPCPCDKQ
jgi:hypothetical protein